MIKKYALPLMFMIVFTVVGLCVFAYKQQVQYFFLFAGIGVAQAFCEWLTIFYPAKKQVIRRIFQAFVGGILFIWLSLRVGVNFQFTQIVVGFLGGFTTAAFIQFIIARIVFPFFVGNGFCSRACWDGAIFELVQDKLPKAEHPKKRNEVIAFSYLIGSILVGAIVSSTNNPAINESASRYWIVGENLVLLTLGVGLSGLWGSRIYCRTFCPFISVSGIFSRFSVFKITPINYAKCTSCGKCNESCPMLVDVRESVKNNKRINNKSCIVCEHCVTACPEKCLRLSPGLPWK
jgi:ferredoxin-type protein NapH